MNPHLAEALELAAKGVGRVSPNPAVGAVIVKDGAVVGRGFHTWAGVKHAEIHALEQAGDQARGATLYVTLEPCSHQGRTPPCADALISAGIAKVVAAMKDPNPYVSGRGFAKLVAAGIQVEIDSAGAAQAEALNPGFLHFMKTGRPLVTVKAAVTLDGKIAAPDDGAPGFTPGWITSEEARRHVQSLRHQSDAILTGIGTVLADDCLLTDRTNEERSRPLLRIVLDSLLRLPLDSRMVTSSRNDVLAITTSAASAERRQKLEDKGIRVEVLEDSDGRADLRAIVDLLAREKYLSLMIEAGSRVNWTALESGVADKIYFYYAPKILGGTQSIPVAGGAGRKRRVDAIQFERVQLHQITTSEFAVEAWLDKRFGGREVVFTGIVEELGTVIAMERHSAGARLVVRCTTVLEDAREGSSIAVNGACLTAVELTQGSFSADLAPETLARTNLGGLQIGSRVNLERPVTPVTRLSGHIVQGHVDGTGELVSLEALGDGNWLKVRVARELDRYMVFKGSVTIDGISLTIAGLEQDAASTIVGVTIIPHTYEHTTLGFAKPGSRLNVEVDVLAKHVEKLLAARQ